MVDVKRRTIEITCCQLSAKKHHVLSAFRSVRSSALRHSPSVLVSFSELMRLIYYLKLTRPVHCMTAASWQSYRATFERIELLIKWPITTISCLIQTDDGDWAIDGGSDVSDSRVFVSSAVEYWTWCRVDCFLERWSTRNTITFHSSTHLSHLNSRLMSCLAFIHS